MAATTVQTFRAIFAFTADENDELSLLPDDLIDCTVIHEGEWGFGVSRRTQKEGAFPWSYVERLKSSQQQAHHWELIKVWLPTICWHTREFLWGANAEAYRCSVCHFTCQKRSRYFVENNSAVECTPVPRSAPVPFDKPVDGWSVQDVRLFLLAARLTMYEPLFAAGQINGSKLKTLNHKKLQSLGIEDTGHRTMINACLEALNGDVKMTDTSFTQRCQISKSEPLNPVQIMDVVPVSNKGDRVDVIRSHKFRVKSFANPMYCDVSNMLLLGLERQGLQCVTCGFNVSRFFADEVPSCQPEVVRINNEPRPPGADVGHCFGLPLAAYLRSGVTEAPALVKKLIAAIEGGRGMKTPGLYKNHPPYVKVQSLQASLLVNPETPLETEEPLVLSTLLKRFFAELPDPLLTGDMYDRFVAAASLPTEEEQIDELDRVALLLPPAHQSTLRFLMKHLLHVAVAMKTTKMDVSALGDMWGPILMRPKEAEAAKAVADAAHQANAVRLLIARCKQGGGSEAEADASAPPLPRKPSSKRASTSTPMAAAQSNYENIVLPRQPSMPKMAKPLPPRKSEEKPRAPPVATENTQSLSSYQWFAGNMDRNEAEAVMTPLVDGAFLVRASQTRRGYSLTVKFREIRHVVIIESGGKFGFTEPTIFNSIAELIRNFERTSLAQYNAELETTLSYPYKTAPRETGQADYDEGPDEDIYVSNVQALREQIARQHLDYRHNPAAQRVAHLDKQMKDLQRQLKAQQQIKALLKDQLVLNQTMHTGLSESDKAIVLNHYSLLSTMIAESEQRERTLAAELEKVAAEDQQFHDESANSVFPNDDMSLAPMPVSPAAGPGLPPPLPAARGSLSLGSTAPLPPHQQQQQRQRHSTQSAIGRSGSEQPVSAHPDEATSAYYVGAKSRDEAMDLLQDCPHGTFLIRKSDRPGHPYSLSLKDQDVVRHIQIKYDGVRFGLAEPLAFTSLDSLCEYYHKETLSNTINIPLGDPIKAIKRVH